MFDPNQVVEINLTVPPEGIENLEKEPKEYTCGEFELKVGGVPKVSPGLPSPATVAIELRGTGSFRDLSHKAAFKIKFTGVGSCKKSSQRYFGLKSLTTNNMVQDPSMIHETLAYEVFRAFGVPSTRTGFAFIRLNGIKYGTYLNIETMDEVSMPRLFLSTQHLYKADTPGVDVRPGQANTFEVEMGSEEDLTDLNKLIAAANSQTGDWSDGLSGLADLREMTREWAVERYIGHWDGYAGEADNFPGPTTKPNNYWLHSDSSGLFDMLPWGTDQTWSVPLFFDQPAGGRLFNSCLKDASCKALYEQALGELASLIPTLNLDGRVVAIAQELAPWQAQETERGEFSAAEIALAVAATRKFIAERPKALADYLASLKPGPAAGARRAKIGKTRIRGTVVYTKITSFSPGSALQRVKVRSHGHWLKGCTGKQQVKKAKGFTVKCHLSHRVRELMSSHRRLRLKVRVGFTPTGGEPFFKIRQLRVSQKR